MVGEFVGRANFANIITPGAEDRGLLRFGARYTHARRAARRRHPARADAARSRDWLHRRLHLGVQRRSRFLDAVRSRRPTPTATISCSCPPEQVEGLRLDELSRRLCERHSGLGGDGVIYYTIAPDGTAQMKLINTDGSPSELSGNGLRCLAALVLHQREQLRSAADHGSARRHRCRLEDAVADQPAGRALHVPRRHGAARARASRRRIEAAGETADGDDARDRQSAVRRAGEGVAGSRALQSARPGAVPRTSDFREGTNVEFAVVEAPDRVRILIWERGVGPTHASGTGACASAIAAIAHGGAARDIEVIAPGGTQRVEWRDDGIYLTGWAEVVFDGRWVPRSVASADLS